MLGALGKREVDGQGTCALADHERGAVRRQSVRVGMQAAVAAVLATAVAWYLV